MKKKVLVLLLIVTIVFSLFAFVACKDPNGNSQGEDNKNQGEIGSGEQNQPDDNKPSDDGNQSGDEDNKQDDEVAVELKPANQNYKGEEIDYSLYFETDGNGKIVALSDYAIQERESIIQIEIPEKIGNEDITALALSFGDLPYLRSIVIPNSVEEIAESVCANMLSIVIYCEHTNKPDGWCQNWNIPENFEEFFETVPVVWDCNSNDIADDGFAYGFSSNGMLMGVKDGQAKIVFSGKCEDKNVALKSKYKYKENKYTLTEIMPYAFAVIDWEIEWYLPNYKNMTNLELPSGLINIGDGAFMFHSMLEKVKIPTSLIEIGDGAFMECNNLTSITIGSNSQLTTISDFAFDYCNSLKTIYIPRGVEYVGEYAFRYCSSLESIDVDINNPNYKSENDCLVEISTNKLVVGCKNSVIPQYVDSIGNAAFYGCVDLIDIEIPNGVKSIGADAFRECCGLTSIEIPISVEYIGMSVFDSVYGVIYCEAASKPSGWDNNWHANRVVWDCKNNDVSEDGGFYYIAENRVIYVIRDGLASVCSYQSKSVRGNIEILSQIVYKDMNYEIKYIESWAFRDCVDLQSIFIPRSVNIIGAWLFDGCKNLTIYCEVESKPSDWEDDWNESNFPVVWGYKKG